jgi:hypothetical protein
LLDRQIRPCGFGLLVHILQQRDAQPLLSGEKSSSICNLLFPQGL